MRKKKADSRPVELRCPRCGVLGQVASNDTVGATSLLTSLDADGACRAAQRITRLEQAGWKVAA